MRHDTIIRTMMSSVGEDPWKDRFRLLGSPRYNRDFSNKGISWHSVLRLRRMRGTVPMYIDEWVHREVCYA